MQNAITRNTPFEELPEFLTPEEYRAYLGLGRSKTYDMLRRNEIRHHRDRKTIRIPKSALAARGATATRNASETHDTIESRADEVECDLETAPLGVSSTERHLTRQPRVSRSSGLPAILRGSLATRPARPDDVPRGSRMSISKPTVPASAVDRFRVTKGGF